MKTRYAATWLLSLLAVCSWAQTAEKDILSYIRTGNKDALQQAAKRDKMILLSTDKYGNTLMMAAVLYGQPAMIKYLNDVYPAWEKQNQYGENAFHLAARYNRIAEAKLIASLAAKDDTLDFDQFINRRNFNAQQTPLHLSALNCNRELYDFLREWGASDTLTDAGKQSPADLLAKCPPPEKTAPEKENTSAEKISSAAQ